MFVKINLEIKGKMPMKKCSNWVNRLYIGLVMSLYVLIVIIASLSETTRLIKPKNI